MQVFLFFFIRIHNKINDWLFSSDKWYTFSYLFKNKPTFIFFNAPIINSKTRKDYACGANN